MEIKKDSNTDIFLICNSKINCIKSIDNFSLNFNPDAKYSKFNFYSKVSIFRYMEVKPEKKLILSINSKTHRNIHFIFHMEELKHKGFHSIKQLFDNDIFINDFKNIIIKENNEQIFLDCKEFILDF